MTLFTTGTGRVRPLRPQGPAGMTLPGPTPSRTGTLLAHSRLAPPSLRCPDPVLLVGGRHVH
ncbi:hypothetical protein E2C01_005302 [Portunus trituberculatus]|uniref:Uncharacterized protein n=1 Tax=Portunus trituberculatus TaxID=210409 RepID=A0A5B7CSZ7_PORTR|nr:hypothetical protein [Portunus trituberculatus]